MDVRLYLVTRKKGSGKSTIAISLGILESRGAGYVPIYSNMKLTIPGIQTFQISKVSELMRECGNDPCTCEPRVIIADEFDKSFTSRIGWVNKKHEQQLTELVSNVRKHRVVAFIATSQLRKKIKNDYRLNCDFAVEPTGTLDLAGCPEYFLWDDIELYEEAGHNRYAYAVILSSLLPLSFLQQTFNTRQVINLEWDSK